MNVSFFLDVSHLTRGKHPFYVKQMLNLMPNLKITLTQFVNHKSASTITFILNVQFKRAKALFFYAHIITNHHQNQQGYKDNRNH